MAAPGNSVYEPEGPASEALSSWYVRNLVQRTLDQAFRLAPPPAEPERHRRTGQSQA